jgi:hypothetical protein
LRPSLVLMRVTSYVAMGMRQAEGRREAACLAPPDLVQSPSGEL